MIYPTKRLILRPWAEADADDCFALARDPRVGPAAGWPVHTSVENSRFVIRNILMVDETYAVCLKEDGKAIGSISLMRGDETNLHLPEGEAELGYWLGVPFWGQGLIPEAAEELLRHGFEDLGLTTVWCCCFTGNTKSKRCMEKCGFVFDHEMHGVFWPALNETKEEIVYRLAKEEWVRRTGRNSRE